MNAGFEPVGRRPGGSSAGFARAVFGPVAIVVSAYVLWWISDRLATVGPLDRATFGWVVVIPVFLAAPAVAALACGRFAPRTAALAAAVLGATVGGAAAVLFWLSVSFPNCGFGTVRTPSDWVVPSLVLGAVIGGGVAASGLLGSRFARQGRPLRAAMTAVGIEVAMVAAAILVGGIMLLGPGCQRPTI